jgi:DNA-binding transcriptional regulator YbjK
MEGEAIQALAESGPVGVLVGVLLLREWKAHLREKSQATQATLDDLVTAVGQLQTSIEGLQSEFRDWFEQKVL